MRAEDKHSAAFAHDDFSLHQYQGCGEKVALRYLKVVQLECINFSPSKNVNNGEYHRRMSYRCISLFRCEWTRSSRVLESSRTIRREMKSENCFRANRNLLLPFLLFHASTPCQYSTSIFHKGFLRAHPARYMQ